MISIDNHRRLQVALLIATSAVVTFSPMWSRRRSNDPIWWMYGAIAVYVITGLIYWHRVKKYVKQPASRKCPVCEYELVKQRVGDLCPECGLSLAPGEREQLWNERLRLLKGEPSEYQRLLQAIRSRRDTSPLAK